jgi:hypothetical protein
MRRLLMAAMAFVLVGLSGCYIETRPQGQAPIPDDQATAIVGNDPYAEHRPENAQENARIPTAAELSYFRSQNDEPTSGSACVANLRQHVTGNFPWITTPDGTVRRPTTIEIIRWAAAKWGIDENLALGAMWNESRHSMDQLGDYVGGFPTSFSIAQIKTTVHAGFDQFTDQGGRPARGGLAILSTAMAMDYWGFVVRSYFEGCNDWSFVTPGNMTHALAAWFNPDELTQFYVDEFQANAANKPWLA